MLFQDARTYQILFLSLFLVLGIGTRDWTLRPGIVLVAIATCVLTQVVVSLVIGHWLENRHEARGTRHEYEKDSPLSIFPSSHLPISPPPHLLTSLPSALITALGLSLLLRTEHYSTMMLAAVVAIASKFLLRVDGKHVFNPANIGIVAAVVLTQNAWVSPGQWGEESWYALLFLGAGGVVLRRVGRWDTTITFLSSYALFEAIRNLWLGWTWDVWAHRLMSGSLLLFALFMVTDPRTIPNARTARIVWAIAIALLAFILRNIFFLPTAVFWSLFALAPLSILLDAIWEAPQFTWTVNAEVSESRERGVGNGKVEGAKDAQSDDVPITMPSTNNQQPTTDSPLTSHP